MRRSALALLACIAALAAAAAAGAGITPLIVASNLDRYLNEQELIVGFGAKDDPVAETTVYVGPGVTIEASKPGDTIGFGFFDLLAGHDYGDTIVSAFADVKAADPASYVSNRCSPGRHAQVWLARLDLLILDVHPAVVIYVDPAPPAARRYASYMLKMCFPSPYVTYPPGAILQSRMLDLGMVFTNFRSAASNRWTVVAEPFKPGTDQADPAAAAEAQSVVRQGAMWVRAKRVSRVVKGHERSFANVHGRAITAGGVGVQAYVDLFAFVGKSRDGIRIARRRTSPRGTFAFRVKLKRPTHYVVIAAKTGAEVTPATCDPVLDIGFGPLSCASETTSDYATAAKTKKLVPPRRGG